MTIACADDPFALSFPAHTSPVASIVLADSYRMRKPTYGIVEKLAVKKIMKDMRVAELLPQVSAD